MNELEKPPANNTGLQAIHSLTESFSKRIGTHFAPGPAHAFHKDLLSTYYVLGVVNRTDLDLCAPRAGSLR